MQRAFTVQFTDAAEAWGFQEDFKARLPRLEYLWRVISYWPGAYWLEAFNL